jgi:hypothetical protein
VPSNFLTIPQTIFTIIMFVLILFSFNYYDQKVYESSKAKNYKEVLVKSQLVSDKNSSSLFYNLKSIETNMICQINLKFLEDKNVLPFLKNEINVSGDLMIRHKKGNKFSELKISSYQIQEIDGNSVNISSNCFQIDNKENYLKTLNLNIFNKE